MQKEFHSYLHWFLRNCSSKLQGHLKKIKRVKNKIIFSDIHVRNFMPNLESSMLKGGYNRKDSIKTHTQTHTAELG